MYTIVLIGGLIFGFVTALIGFVLGLCCKRLPAQVAPLANAPISDSAEETAAKARIASDNLVVLAERMANDVDAHTIKIEAISAVLQDNDGSPEERSENHEKLPQRILEANYQLQHQLAKAKEHIEKQAAQLRRRESEALTDSLTGLSNRRAFEDEMRKQIAGWERRATPFNLLMLDIDHFKGFNDSHGHQTGDAVLAEVARVIGQQLRTMDTAYRYGGEEFAVILPATVGTDAGIVAERIRKAIEQAVVNIDNKALKVTISIGSADVVSGDQIIQIIRRADEALYKSKEAGRNCVHRHNGREVLPLSHANKPIGVADSSAASENTEVATKPQAAFNRELTRIICESRREVTPLSLVFVRANEPTAKLNKEPKGANYLSTQLATKLIEANLNKDECVISCKTNELFILLPGKAEAAAQGFMEQLNLKTFGLNVETFELLPMETAEQFLTRARGGAAMSAVASDLKLCTGGGCF